MIWVTEKYGGPIISSRVYILTSSWQKYDKVHWGTLYRISIVISKGLGALCSLDHLEQNYVPVWPPGGHAITNQRENIHEIRSCHDSNPRTKHKLIHFL